MQYRSDIIGSVLLIFLGIGVIIESIRLKVGTPLMPQPGFFPFLGGFLLAGLSVALLVHGWRGRGKESLKTGESFGEWRRPAILVAGMCVYTAVLESLGFVLPTLIIAILILRVLGVKSWKVLIVSSLGLSVGTYILFRRILGVELPSGILTFLG